MPAYQIELRGQKYRVDAADEAELQATVAELEREHAQQGEEKTHEDAVDASPRTRGWFADVGASVARGGMKAVEAASDVLSFIPEDAGIYVNSTGLSFTKGDAAGLEDAIDAIGAPETKAGAIAEGVTQFTVGAIPVFKAAKAASFLQGAAKATTALRGITLGAATSGVFFDGQEANLANLVQAVPALANPITEFMATDEDTPEVVGRLKNAVMDAVGGVAVEGIIGLVRAAKYGAKAKAAPEATPAEVTPTAPVAPEPPPSVFDAVDGAGNTPNVEEIAKGKRGFVRELPIAAFRSLAAHLPSKQVKDSSLEFLKSHLDGGGKVAPLYLQVQWDDALKAWNVVGHEGRHRAIVLSQRMGDDATVPIHLDTRAADGTRLRPDDLTPEQKAAGFVGEDTAKTHALLKEAERVTGVSAGNAPEAQFAAKAPEPAPATTVDALAAKEPGYGDLTQDEAVDRLSRRLGITGEKLGKIREALQRGVPGEDLEKLIDLNPKHIDWSNVRNAEDVVALMNTVTRTLGDEVAQKAGYAKQTVEWVQEQAAKLADETGGGYKDAVGIVERVKDLPATVVLQRKLVTASATHLRGLAEKIAKGVNSPVELLEFVAHERRHALLQVAARGTRAQIGRALRMMQEGVKVSEDSLKLANAKTQRAARQAADKTGKPIEVPTGRSITADEADEALRQAGLDSGKVRTLADYIIAHPDLEEINRVARMSLYEKVEEKLTALYINNILSGIPTMAVNVFSGLYKIVESNVEHFGAAAVSVARGGDKWERVASMKAVGASMTSWRTAWTLAGKAWKEGLPQTDIMARHEVQMRGGAPEGIVETALSLPSRTIVTIDEFFKQVFYQQELAARAVEVAANAARLEKGKAAQEATFKRVLADTMKAPPDDLMLDAIERARYQTFQNDPQNKLINWLMAGTNKIAALRLILPFIKTPYNIVAQAAERSPLALLSGRVRGTLAGQYGKRAQGEMITRVALGSAGIGMVWNYAGEGRITGSRVGGKGLRNTADMEAPPYSIKIGDTWYQYNRLDPLGTILGLTVDLRLYYNNRQERQENGTTIDDPEATEAMSAIMGIFVENMADKAFFKGVSDFFEAVGSVRDGGGGAFLSTYANNLAVNFVPYSAMQRNIARSMDDVTREAWTLMDRLKAQTPGFSQDLPARRDLLGREVKQMDRLGADWASPFGIGKDETDPVARELASLDLAYRMPDKDIAGVKMTATQYSRMLEVRGGVVYGELDALMKAGEWQTLSRFQKSDHLRKVFSKATSLAEATVMEENPDLGALVEQQKNEVAAVKAGELQ